MFMIRKGLRVNVVGLSYHHGKVCSALLEKLAKVFTKKRKSQLADKEEKDHSAGHDEHNSNDEAVKGESLSEDHHKDKSNQNILLPVGANTSITDDSNGETGGEG